LVLDCSLIKSFLGSLFNTLEGKIIEFGDRSVINIPARVKTSADNRNGILGPLLTLLDDLNKLLPLEFILDLEST